MSAGLLFPLIWGGWAVSWIVAAFWAAPVVQRRRGPAVFFYRGMMGAGLALIAVRGLPGLPSLRLWDVGRAGAGWLAVGLLPGLAFAWWARVHLGRLWSGSVTRQVGHRVVESGPYAIVRHPIYTGLLAASLVSAIAAGTVEGWVGLGLMLAGIWVKARLEERLLESSPALEGYGAYRARVPMLVPYWPMRWG